MSFIRGGESVQIKRRSKTSRDEFGNNVYQETTLTVRDVLVAIDAGSEPADAVRDHVDQTLTLYFPNGTKVQDGDRFVIRGTQWLKDSAIQNWISPFAGLDAGVVVKVRRRNG
jgi:hypothetical protein